MINTTQEAIKYLKSIDIHTTKRKNDYLVIGYEVYGITKDLIDNDKELIQYANEWKELMEME